MGRLPEPIWDSLIARFALESRGQQEHKTYVIAKLALRELDSGVCMKADPGRALVLCWPPPGVTKEGAWAGY